VNEPWVTAEQLAGPERHLFLSPHYDDIALSCGGTAALLARAGRRPEVALIFGAEPDPAAPLTSFAQSMHRDWGMDARQVIAGRRAEEAAAGGILGTTDLFLPFWDAIYRGERYTSNELLFGTPAVDEDGLPGEIVDALRLPDEGRASTRLYAPLGVGRHVDHQQVFRAGAALARGGWEVWFFEDLSYALNAGAREERLAATGEALKPVGLVDVTGVWQAKLEAIMAYPSQLATVFGYVDSGSTREEIDTVMRRYAEEVGGGTAAERFWRIEGDAVVP
jgi:LmbE family N-acetylglucosaminyl deacetylase